MYLLKQNYRYATSSYRLSETMRQQWGYQSFEADKFPEETLYTSNLIDAKEYFDKKVSELDKNTIEDLFKKLINDIKFNFYEIDEDLDVFVAFETMNNRGKPLTNLELLKNRLIYLSTLLDDDKSDLNQ